MKLETLKELGLSNGQIAVYKAVLELGISSLNKIQEKTGIERRNIYDILNKLIEKGFISHTIEKGKRSYQCMHPNKILDEIKIKRKALSELESEVPEIKNLFEFSRPEIRAEVLRGNESIKAILNELLDYKESFWIGGNSGIEQQTGDEMKRWFKHWMNERVKRKHVLHDLLDYGTYLEGLEPEKIEVHKKNYYKRCELPKHFSSPMVMVIFGNKVLQILWSKQTFAFVLDSEEIKDSFMKYFQYFWKEPY